MKPLIILALILTGCITSPETKTVHRDYSFDPACLKEDSTTWTDTTETQHMSCTIDPRANNAR